MVFFFFFSSRRRHTRCYRDWSSDVCSSDLGLGQARPGEAPVLLVQRRQACRQPWHAAGGDPDRVVDELRPEGDLELEQLGLVTLLGADPGDRDEAVEVPRPPGARFEVDGAAATSAAGPMVRSRR